MTKLINGADSKEAAEAVVGQVVPVRWSGVLRRV